MKRALTKIDTDQKGNLVADSRAPLYLVAEREDGSEEFILATNMASFIHKLAKEFSLEMGNKCESCRIIDGISHRALFRYEAEKGLQVDWEEKDLRLAKGRGKNISKDTFTPLSGKRFIYHD